MNKRDRDRTKVSKCCEGWLGTVRYFTSSNEYCGNRCRGESLTAAMDAFVRHPDVRRLPLELMCGANYKHRKYADGARTRTSEEERFRSAADRDFALIAALAERALNRAGDCAGSAALAAQYCSEVTARRDFLALVLVA